MFEFIPESIVGALAAANINAVTKFPASKLDRTAAVVCVSLRSARVSASGCGNYIGLCTQNGAIKEMYGSKAELVISLDIYSPADPDSTEPGCAEYAGLVREAIMSIQGLSITEFEFGDVYYDTDGEMFRSNCTAKAKAFLVREMLDGELSAYGLGETV
nr:MAG TPA: hypothetical protein [Caudoviricetes sp.]